MSVQSENPNLIERFVAPDGRLTVEGLLIILRIVEDLQSIDGRVTALEP